MHDVWKMPILQWTCSRIDALSFIIVVPSYYHFFVSYSHIVCIQLYLESPHPPPPILAPFSLFYDPIVSYLRKEKWQWKQGYLFCFVLNHIILIRKCFLTSAYFFPFNMKSLFYQKLSSLKTKFCFCFLFYCIVFFLRMQQKYEMKTRLT